MKNTRLRTAALTLGLFSLTLLLFFPALQFEFVNYDDNVMVTANSEVLKGLTLEGITRAFTSLQASNWVPLSWISHMADVELFGVNPAGHHLVSVLLHGINASLLFLVLQAMTGAPWKSFVVAALFAVHPLHVESVAWVAERRDVLSTFFWLLVMGAYYRYALKPGWPRYLPMLVCYALGLMAKPMLVTLPLVLLLLDWWPLERLRAGIAPKKTGGERRPSPWRLIVEKVPLMILALASSTVTFAAQKAGGAVAGLQDLPASTRIANALAAFVVYLWKMIWPRGLAVYYPHPGASLHLWQAVGAGLLLAAITVVVLRLRRHPYLPVGWFWYLGTLVPVSGIVQVGSQSMADRFTYVPYIGLFIALVWGLSEAADSLGIKPAVPWAATAAVLVLLALQARSQLWTWRDSGTLFTHALAVTENNYLAHNNLGTFLASRGREQEALDHLLEAVRIEPDFAEAHFNLGNRYLHGGDLLSASERYREALRLDPGMADAHLNLGLLHQRRGELPEAALQYRSALELNPRLVRAHANRGAVLEKMGLRDEARLHLRMAFSLDPRDADALYNLGVSFMSEGRLREAADLYRQVLSVRPDYSVALLNLGSVQMRRGLTEEAILSYRRLLKIEPDSAEGRKSLERALRHRENLE